jgi:threonine synthase
VGRGGCGRRLRSVRLGRIRPHRRVRLYVSGASSHADRLATIRRADKDYATVVDTHTADGLKVALEQRDPAVATLVLETAQPAKFEETIVEALGRKPARPAGLENIEALPQRVEVMDVDAQAIKALIARVVDAG